MLKRILYIEDDLVDQKLFLRALKDANFQIDIADNFETAYELKASCSYDLIVSDHHVGPDDLLDEIENWDTNKLIVLSNQIESKALQDYICFEKPFRSEMLSILNESEKDRPNIDQLDMLSSGDEAVKTELLELIQKELEETILKLSVLTSEEKKQKAAIIHKVLNKIAILNMKESKLKLLNFETQLNNNIPLSIEQEEVIGSILHTALRYVKQTL